MDYIMSLILQSSGGGQITIQEPATASNFTQTLPASDGTILTSASQSIPKAALPTGSVLQVVNGTSTSSFSTTSATPSDIGLSATITPTSSTSKILVRVCVNQLNTNSTNQTGGTLSLVYQTTTLFTFDSFIAYSAASAESDNYIGGSSVEYLHSPATTSSITYKIQASRNTGSGNFRIMPASSAYSTITLLEIAA
jgi:hypothetical protein